MLPLNAAVSLVLPWPWLLALAFGLTVALDKSRIWGGGVHTAVTVAWCAAWAFIALRLGC